MSAAQIVLIATAVYAVLGLLFALASVTRGIGRIDHAAQGAPIGFRLIIFPASAALWPVLLRKWWRSPR